MVGDRETDLKLAENLQVRGFKVRRQRRAGGDLACGARGPYFATCRGAHGKRVRHASRCG